MAHAGRGSSHAPAGCAQQLTQTCMMQDGAGGGGCRLHHCGWRHAHELRLQHPLSQSEQAHEIVSGAWPAPTPSPCIFPSAHTARRHRLPRLVECLYRQDMLLLPHCRTNTTVLATGGFRGDISTLQKLLRAKLVEYEHKHGEPMKVRDERARVGRTG